jgi:predicted NAD/FAD-dependent oxidoreductase
MRYAIVGAGLAGLTCAGELSAAGHEVVLFDKGRGPGGRMSTRRMETRFGTAFIDHGAPCFQATDPTFRKVVRTWEDAGVVEPWPLGGLDAWVGVPRMSSVIGHLAAPHDVFWNTFVRGICGGVRGAWHVFGDQGHQGPFDAVVLAVPAEQAVPILALYDLEMARAAAQGTCQPCWAGLFVFGQELPVPAHPLRETGIVAFAAPNRGKSMREGPEAWVVHATPEWSVGRLEEHPSFIAPILGTALKEALGLTTLPPFEATAHRWRYATAGGANQTALWNADIGLGACGDWLIGPRAECAWRSGQALARMILASRRAQQPRLRRAPS